MPGDDLDNESWELQSIEAARWMEQGRLAHEQGRYPDAEQWFEQALERFRALRNRNGEANALGNLGTLYQDQDRATLAIENLERAIAILRDLGDRRGEGNFMTNLANLYGEQGQFHLAVERYQVALEVAQEMGNRRGESMCLGNLGAVYQAQGQDELALEFSTRALTICREVGDRRNEGVFLGNIGVSLSRLLRLDEAEMAMRQAIDICDDTFTVAAGAFRGALAQLLAERDRFNEVAELLRVGRQQVQPIAHERMKFMESEKIIWTLAEANGREGPLRDAGTAHPAKSHEAGADGAESVEDPEQVSVDALRLLEQARLECTEGHYDLALENANAALLHFQAIGEAVEEVKAMSLIGVLHQNRGEHSLAVSTFELALARARSVGVRGSEASILGTLGLAALNRGDWDAAQSLLDQALHIQKQMGDLHGEVYNLGTLALLHHRRGQFQHSIQLYEQAIDCARTVGDKISEGVFLGNFGEVLTDMELFEKAEDVLGRAIGICDTAIPPAAGSFRASLALLMGRMRRFDEVSELFEMGEVQVAAIPAEHVRLLCKKGHVYHLSGDLKGAESVLKQAQEIARSLHVGDGSEVGRAMAKLAASLNDGTSEEAPLHGE